MRLSREFISIDPNILINYELCKTNVWIFKYGEFWIYEKFSSCLYNSCIFLYSDYICNSLYVTRIFGEPHIYYLIFDNFQYLWACKLNYISVFILNFFIIFLELNIK